jgi:hypothetical protein
MPKINLTLRLDADLVREARLLAVREGSSISALLARRLDELVREEKAYERARRRAVGRLATGFPLALAATRPAE